MTQTAIPTPMVYPEGEAVQSQIGKRHKIGLFWRTSFLAATIVGILTLIVLLNNIINGAFGLVAMENKIPPQALLAQLGLPAATPLDILSETQLAQLIQQNMSAGLGRRFEREQLFLNGKTFFYQPQEFNDACEGADPLPACSLPVRSRENLLELVVDEVVQPNVVATFSLVDSLFKRGEIALLVSQEYPQASIEI